MAKIKISREERERRDSNLQAQMDYNSNIAYVVKKAAIEIAGRMKKDYRATDIAKYTRLSIEEIEAIQIDHYEDSADSESN